MQRNQNYKGAVSYTDFIGGETAPAARGRLDDKYLTRAKEMKNCRPTRQGGLEGRQGFRHYLNIDGDYARVFPLGIEGFEDGAIIFRDDDTAHITSENIGTRRDYVVNPRFDSQGAGWEGSGYTKVWTDNLAVLFPTDIPGALPDGWYFPEDLPATLVSKPNRYVDFNAGCYVNAPLVLRASTRHIVGGRAENVPLDIMDTAPPDSYVGRVSQEVTVPSDGTDVYLDIRLVCTGFSKEIVREAFTLSDGTPQDLDYTQDGKLPFPQHSLDYGQFDIRWWIGAAEHKTSQTPFSDMAAVVEIGTTEGAGDLERIYLKDYEPVVTTLNNGDIKPVDALSRFVRGEGTANDLKYMENVFPGRSPEDLRPLLGYRLQYRIKLTGIPQTVAPIVTTDVWLTVRAYGNATLGEPLRTKRESIWSKRVIAVRERPFYEEEIGVEFASLYSESLVAFSGVELASPFPAAALRGLQSAMPPEQNAIYFTSAGYAPQILSYDAGTSTWGFNAVPNTNFPVEWGGTEFPGCVGFYQGRAWWGGVESFPYRLYGSKSGDYSYMTLPVGTPVASDPVAFDLAAGGRIVWIASREDLLIGTTMGEMALRADGGVLSAATPPRVTVQSYYGSSDVQAALVGGMVVFADASGKKLRGIDFNWQTQSWLAPEISADAEHLVRGVRDLWFSNTPDATLWMVNEDGQIVGLTVAPEKDSLGAFHYDLGGKVLSLGVASAIGDGRLWAIVQRQGQLSVEVSSPDVLLDHAISYVNALDPDITYSRFNIPAAAENLPHATVNGYPAQIFRDTALLTSYIDNVPQGADVTLGYKFECAWQPLPPITSGYNPVLPVKQVRRGRIRVYDSAPPFVNGTPPRDQDTLIAGGLPNLKFTGDIRIEPETVEALEGLIRVSQPEPVPFNIAGVFIEISEDQL